MIRVFNSLSRGKEVFEPNSKDRVNMYVCGITPYDSTHIGHGRCYLTFDLVKRYLEFRGYKVFYVQNFTDIDDKIIKKAGEENVGYKEIADKYIKEFFEMMDALNIKRADLNPRVTENIDKIILAVENLIESGSAYELNGDVYFRVRNFKDYGKLSGKNIEDLEAGARVEVNEEKEDPLDFAVWKKAKEGEPFWESTWGKGRPGWHIECSVLALDNIGDMLDIHGGGVDLIFPHHENEIAQAESMPGCKRFAKYWMHNGFVMIDKEKMSKSLGNFFSLKDVFKKYEPMVLRLFLVSQHYRNPLEFSDDKLEENKRRLARFIEFGRDIKYRAIKPCAKLPEELEVIKKEFIAGMDDDFNSAIALSCLHKILEYGHKHIDKEEGASAWDLLQELADILGLVFETQEEELEPEFKDLIKSREKARQDKNWKEADRIRDLLSKQGIEIKDTNNGTEWKRT